MKLFVVYLTIFCSSGFALASAAYNLPSALQFAPDQPDTDETFASFFARITRGGGFPGIRLVAPEKIQAAFLKSIRQNYWVGKRNTIMKELDQQGIDIWNNWYKEKKSIDTILNSSEKRMAFAAELQLQIENDHLECDRRCPNAKTILESEWQNLDSFSRQEFAKTMAFSKSLYAGKSILDRLGEVYNFSAIKVQSSTRIRILANTEFIKAVRELGYEGEIYFRGITAPDPQQPDGHVILLNDEKIYKNSPFENELLKNLEIVGILVHELSHVYQDLKGQALGVDVQVRSAEAALLIEGSAEFLAEQAMLNAANAEVFPSALKLFVSEQAVEIIYRAGNESTGQLFPYTVGLPFAAALYLQNESTNSTPQILTEKILQFLGDQRPLQEWLKTL
ncbi:MAG: hypothetical protein H7061_11380 [Bdellovibrionaceae bacterium]|nr:hypothetical protein [Bdellovibrio sp.]